jgi:GTPase SAR1 family protein
VPLSRLDFSSHVRWPLLKLFLVGDGGAGKTSVVRAMRRQKFDTTASTDGAEASTFVLGRGSDLGSRDWEHLVDAMRVQLGSPSQTHDAAPSSPPSPSSSSLCARPHADVAGSVLKEIWTWKSLFKWEVSGYAIADAPASLRRRIERDRIVTVWDLAGQSQYFTSHRHFFSRRALYVVVVNLHPETQDFREKGVMHGEEQAHDFLRRRCKFWNDYVQLKAPGERFVVVFTHADVDGMSADELRRRVDLCISELRGANAYAVVGLQAPKSEAANARTLAADVGVGLGAVNSIIEHQFDEITTSDESRYPLGWIMLARELLQHADRGRLLLKWDEVRDIARRCGVLDDEALKCALAAITQTTAVHLLVEHPGPYLFLRCQWLADLFRAFVTKDDCLVRRLNGCPLSESDVERVKAGEMSEAAVQHVWYNFLDEKLRGMSATNALSAADVAILGAFPVVILLQSFRILFPVGGDRFVLPGRVVKRRAQADAASISLEAAIPLGIVPAELDGQLYASVYAHSERFSAINATDEGLFFVHNGRHHVLWVDPVRSCVRVSQRELEPALSGTDMLAVVEHFERELQATGFTGATARLHCPVHRHVQPMLIECRQDVALPCPPSTCAHPARLAGLLGAVSSLRSDKLFQWRLRTALFDALRGSSRASFVDMQHQLDLFHGHFGYSQRMVRDKFREYEVQTADDLVELFVRYRISSRRSAVAFAPYYLRAVNEDD